MDQELTGKFLDIASKLGLPDDLLSQIKDKLSSGGGVSVTKVSVSGPTSADVDKMSEQEAKDLLKKILDKKSSEGDGCEDGKSAPMPQKPENPLMRAMKSKF